MDERVDKVILLYEIFYRDYSGNSKFRFNFSKSNLSLVHKFVKMLDHRHDDGWMFDFFCFQFESRSKQNISLDFMFGRVKIMLSWVIGQKAFNNYLSSSDERRYYGRRYAEIRGINNPFRQIFSTISREELKDFEDRERRRFLNNGDMGLVHCTGMQIRYNKKSKLCLVCKNKSLCVNRPLI